METLGPVKTIFMVRGPSGKILGYGLSFDYIPNV